MTRKIGGVGGGNFPTCRKNIFNLILTYIYIYIYFRKYFLGRVWHGALPAPIGARAMSCITGERFDHTEAE